MWDDRQERFVMATNPRFRYAPSGLLAQIIATNATSKP